MTREAFFSNIRTLYTKPIATIKSYIRTHATRRFGQAYSHADAQEAIYRIPILNLIAIILPEKAMKEGFDLVDSGGEPMDEIMKIWNKDNFLPDIIKGAQYDSAHGAVTFAFFEGRDDKDLIELLCFEPDDVGIFVNENGFIKRFELVEKIGAVNRPEIIHHIPRVWQNENEEKFIDEDYYNEDEEHISPEEQLANVFHTVLRKGKVRFRGVPKIEIFWDVGHAHGISLEAAMVGTVRAAYGKKIATVHHRTDKDVMDAVERKIDDGLANYGSADSAMILYSGTDSAGQKWEDKVSIDTGDMNFNYAEKIDIFHKIVAFLSGLPKNYLDGLFAGETLAGDIIYRMIQTVLREIRDEWTEYLIPVIERWAFIRGLDLGDGWKLEWRMPKAKLTEKEEAEIDAIIADTQSTLKTAGIIDTEEARTTLEKKPFDKEIQKPADMTMSVEGLEDNNPPPQENIPSDKVGATTP